MDELLQKLINTPLPTIFIVAGIFFLFLSVSGGLAGKINVPPHRQKLAGVVGGALLAIGLAVYLFSDDPSRPGSVAPVDDAAKNAATERSGAAGEKSSGAGGARQWPLLADEAFVNNDARWAVGQSYDVDIAVAAGKYRWETTSSKNAHGWRWQLTPHPPVADFYLATDVRWASRGPGPSAAGLVFRRAGEREYRLLLSSDGYMTLNYSDGKKANELIGWVWIPNLVSGQAQRIAVVAEGPTLKVYVNDRPFGEINDASIRAGNVGLWTEWFEQRSLPLVVEFDNFELRQKP